VCIIIITRVTPIPLPPIPLILGGTTQRKSSAAFERLTARTVAEKHQGAMSRRVSQLSASSAGLIPSSILYDRFRVKNTKESTLKSRYVAAMLQMSEEERLELEKEATRQMTSRKKKHKHKYKYKRPATNGKHSSSFASSVSRFGTPDKGGGLGPGDYEAWKALDSKTRKKSPLGFDKVVGRPDHTKRTKDLPGPGEYEIEHHGPRGPVIRSPFVAQGRKHVVKHTPGVRLSLLHVCM
jgi:hypothetical protein